MAYTALELVTRAYYLSQIVAREAQTVSGSQISDGLYLLNALLDVKASDLQLIPYYQEYDFTSVAGQEMYFIPNLLEADTVTYYIGQVRFAMSERTRKEYFGIPRVDGIQALSFDYRIERCLGGANIYFYFFPEAAYTYKIWGKFSLTDVTLNTDLSLIYDLYYIEYLRYALAEYICCEFGSSFPDTCKAKLAQIVKKLKSISPSDLSISKRSFFNTGCTFDWQTINLTTGWIPF